MAEWPIERVKVADIKGEGILKIYKDLKIFKEGSTVDFSSIEKQENLRALQAYDAISDFETLYRGNADMDSVQMKSLDDAIFNSDVNSKILLSTNCHDDVREYINKFQAWSADDPPEDSEHPSMTEEKLLMLSSVVHPPDGKDDSESLNHAPSSKKTQGPCIPSVHAKTGAKQ